MDTEPTTKSVWKSSWLATTARERRTADRARPASNVHTATDSTHGTAMPAQPGTDA